MRHRKVAVACTTIFFIVVVILVISLTNGYRLALLVNGFLVKFRPHQPVFWNTDDIPWARTMRENYKTLRDEVNAFSWCRCCMCVRKRALSLSPLSPYIYIYIYDHHNLT